MARHNELGKWGEEKVKEYLIGEGYAIFAEDAHRGRKEVDIVALKGDRVYFVEVKTRSTDDSDPFEAIDATKRRNICRFADNFLREKGLPLIPQFDIVAVIGTPETGVVKMEYIPDAFLPSLGR